MAAGAAAAATVSCQGLEFPFLLAPTAILSANRNKYVIGRFQQQLKCKPSALCFLSCSWTSNLHASCEEKSFFPFSAKSTSFFGEKNGVLQGVSRLPTRRRSPLLPKAYKSDFSGLHFPVLDEKPQWWWRTLACVPYVFALSLSVTGNFIQPFLEHYNYSNLAYYVSGAAPMLPAYFLKLYYCIGLRGVVKNKEIPHFLRFHFMMGILLEKALQVVCYASNIFPLFNGTFGMYYWAGVGFAFILILLQCVGCALAGRYAQIPGISDAALIHISDGNEPSCI